MAHLIRRISERPRAERTVATRTRRKLLCAHGCLLLVGTLTLLWVSVPLEMEPWDAMSSVTWQFTVVPAVVLGIFAGLFEGMLARHSFIAVVAVLAVVSYPVWWVCGFMVARNNFGSEQAPTQLQALAGFGGWTLYCILSCLIAVGIARALDRYR